MKSFENEIFKLNSSIDIYKIGEDILEFYFISNRKKITICVSNSVILFIQCIDGKKTLNCICKELHIDILQVSSFVMYLKENNIIHSVNHYELDIKELDSEDIKRYSRQIEFFNTYNIDKSGYKVQTELQNEILLIFGLGAIGSGIAVQLAMAGIRNFILVDKSKVNKSSLIRHFSLQEEDIGRSKVECISSYLKSIDNKISVKFYEKNIDYDTPITDLITSATFIVNTLDEPYIGLTSAKIGRECFYLNKPLFIAGGFDGHLMSTGELIIPHETPCVDCFLSFFNKELKNWTPHYNVNSISQENIENNLFEVGGLASMSLFSFSYASTTILNYLVKKNFINYKSRGELLFNEIEIKYLDVKKDSKCPTCSNDNF